MLFTRLTVRSLQDRFVVLVISYFGFKDRILILIVPVPGHWLLLFLQTLLHLHQSLSEPDFYGDLLSMQI